MNLKITIKNQQISLFLTKAQKNEIVAKHNWRDKKDLSTRLLAEIDRLLKKYDLKPTDLKKVEYFCNMEESYSTYRIGKSVSDCLNYCLENSND
ncbi:MAG: hypothetical protein GF335_04265 [Candidatus Moranbacteria bacterium]|nr:hypothetical protein [Candidatus Moranbacteria bacterium]